MVYYKYFTELKYRIILLVLTWFSSIIICYIYKETLLFLTISFSEFQDLTKVDRHLIFTNVTELFTVYMSLALFTSTQAVIVMGLYHLLLFLTPSFYLFEYNNALFLIKTFFVVWWFSIIFLNRVLVPLSWSFFTNFNKTGGTNAFDLFFEAKVDQYLEYYINLYHICLLNSIVIIILIVSINLLNSNLKTIRSSRKVYYCFFLILATLVTPPDISSQLFFSFCFSIFYEIFVFTGILKAN